MQEKEKYPLVSAICILDHLNYLKINKLIECFNCQSYPNKELIIVNNQKSQYSNSKLELRAQKDIFIVDTPVKVSAGMARNYGISAANGTILAHFDSDYYHHSNRIEAQITSMAQNDAHGSVLSKCLQYSFISGRADFQYNKVNLIYNTLVCVRPENIDYPDVEKSEEKGFIERYLTHSYKIISIDQPELACKLFLHNKMSEEVKGNIAEEYLSIVKRIHSDYLNYIHI